MISLDEHNKQKAMLHRKLSDPYPNGIACPQCGKELWDTDPTEVLASNPPKKRVHCPSCGFVSFATK